MARAAYAVPPELRRLRDAWLWMQRHNSFAAATAAKCGTLTEKDHGGGTFTMTGRTETGGGVHVSISPSRICLLRVEVEPARVTLPLPPELLPTSARVRP